MSENAESALDAIINKHPLQRLNSPSRGVSAFIHVLGLASFSATFKYLVDNPNPTNDSYGWHFQYLTIIGLALASITFAIGLIADITLSRRLFLIKNALSFCSAPLEILISVLYWSLRTINKELVMPKWVELDPRADIGFHAMPAIMLAVDLLFFSPPWTFGSVPAVGISAVLAFAYWIWIEVCYSHNGWYPYPLFEVLDTPSRAALFGGSALVMTGSAFLLKFVYARINGTSIKALNRSKAKPGAAKR